MIPVGGRATSPSSPFGFDPHADALAGFDLGWNGCSAPARAAGRGQVQVVSFVMSLRQFDGLLPAAQAGVEHAHLNIQQTYAEHGMGRLLKRAGQVKTANSASRVFPLGKTSQDIQYMFV
jgi:hypothetical protein